MAGPIYKFFMLRPLAPWYDLSEEEQQRLFSELEKTREEVGAKVVLICDSAWSSERWQYFGVEEYPNIEAVQRVAEKHRELDWYKYLVSETLLGTKTEE